MSTSNTSGPGFSGPLPPSDSHAAAMPKASKSGDVGSQGDREVIFHLIGNLPLASDQNKGWKIFEDHSIVEGAFLSPEDRECLLATSKKVLGKAFETSDVQPKTPMQKLEEQRQKIREFYLRETSLYALTGHRAGSALPSNLNNFINSLGIKDAQLLMEQMCALIKPSGELIEKDPGLVFFNAVEKQKSLLVQLLCAVGCDCPAVSQGLQIIEKDNENDPEPIAPEVQEAIEELNALEAAEELEELEELEEPGEELEDELEEPEEARGLGEDLRRPEEPIQVRAGGAQGNRGISALMYAARHGDLAMVQALINAGANIGGRDRCGRTVFMYAAQSRNPALMQALLNAGAHLDIEFRDAEGKTVLMHALDTVNQDSRIVSLLLAAGANPRSQDFNNRTILMYAISRGAGPEIIQPLIKNAPDILELQAALEMAMSDIFRVNIEVVSILFNAIVNAHRARNQEISPIILSKVLVWTAQQPERSKLLLQDVLNAINQLNVEARVAVINDQQRMNYIRTTALIAAVSCKNLDAVSALLKAGASIDMQNEKGETALMYASFKNDLDIVRALLKAGANIDMPNEKGETALMLAGHPEVVSALLGAGARIDMQDQGGATALISAVRRGNPEVVKALFSANPCTDIQDFQGMTAIKHAKKGLNHWKSVEGIVNAAEQQHMKFHGRPFNAEERRNYFIMQGGPSKEDAEAIFNLFLQRGDKDPGWDFMFK